MLKVKSGLFATTMAFIGDIALKDILLNYKAMAVWAPKLPI